MSGDGTGLEFKYVQDRLYTSTDALLLWLWERYAASHDNGDEPKGNATRNIIEAIMDAKP